MIYKKSILTIAAFIGTGNVFGYSHEELKKDSLRLLDIEMQEKAGVEVDFWAAEEEICQKWATAPYQELDKIINRNDRKVFDFLQETLTFKKERDAKEDLWKLFTQAVNNPEIAINANPIVMAWVEEIKKPTSNSQNFAYSHEDEARKLDNKVIYEFVKLFSKLKKSKKDLFKAFILKSQKDLFFGRLDCVEITRDLLLSQRRADMVDALNDQQLAYLIFNFTLEDAPSIVDCLVELIHSSL